MFPLFDIFVVYAFFEENGVKILLVSLFFHTFADIESAKDFVVYLTQRINNKELTKKPELYKLPTNADLVILSAIIPKCSLYYEWPYKEVKYEKTYASNKIIYLNISRK